MHELREEAVRDAAAGTAVNVDQQRQRAALRPTRRRQQQTPDLHAVERSPADRFQLAKRAIVQLRIDVGQFRRAPARRVHHEHVAHRPAFRRLEREPPAVIRKARRVVHCVPGHETLAAAICERHARDRLIEHVLAASERAVVGFEVDRLAVLRPHELVHPRIVHRKSAHRAASRRHDRETARRHDVGLAVRRREREELTVGRVARTIVHAGAIHNGARHATVSGDRVKPGLVRRAEAGARRRGVREFAPIG